jgi:Domain of Unknown Function (DUF1259)
MRAIHLLTAFCLAIGFSSPAGADVPWTKVGEALGKQGAMMPGGVYRVALPRTDLHVSVDGTTVKPALALGGWLAFREMGANAMVMGDLVLTETEIAPVMTRLAAAGIDITALHNHLLRATPNTMYMHILGHGDAVKLAQELHDALAASGTPLKTILAAGTQPQTIELDTAALDRTFGFKGKINGGVYQVSIPRSEAITDDGMPVPAAMGSANAINFQPLGGGKAAIAGDLVLLAHEVNPVLRVLRENGIEVTAVHNHMLDDQPHLFFMHFWARNDALMLAKAMRAALDKTSVVVH